ncbi:aldolase/citrate lyase family protein [Xinfangfangia sp. CPCC 101601]|uniref:Aldolase/citrate lyase family protein n=1 Tax=Pseudogemmobacter lacusdianii TaxID=3069608 RepID=A0ABU0VT63_9RHOB|nr:aldolase/citrate lyase family protein [Xinfangfangia sp. CPCC 101601]MDQ2064909.1 aldolase/citrate lyase family protein [Xinfangfangia sp. CPCC 101601]
MTLMINTFKRALKAGHSQIGIWNTIAGPVVPELLAGTGFDWILLDTEHSVTDLPDLVPMLQAVAAYPIAPVVRPQANDTVLIKRALDLGAQTLLLPYIQTPAEAEAAVRAMRYAPRGIRGVSGLTRASRFGAIKDYVNRAEDELCLIVQVETGEALSRLEEIATVDGVDAVFIGPSDLAASLGHPGNAGHPDVVSKVEEAILRLKAVGVPSGILTLDQAFARRCLELGTTFTAVGVDMALLRNAALALAKGFGRPHG